MTNPQFGAPHTHTSHSFEISQNPLRGENALSAINITKIIKKKMPKTDVCKIVWVNDRDFVSDKNVVQWLEKHMSEDWDTVEQCANVMMRQFYNLLMPLHAELWWTYTSPEGIIKSIIVHKEQPMYNMPATLKDRVNSL
jgi:hypothetical protein